LLGVVWFDANDTTQGVDWRLTDRAALTAFSQAAKTFMRPLTTPGLTQYSSSSTSSP
jgi:hypothetical protein